MRHRLFAALVLLGSLSGCGATQLRLDPVIVPPAEVSVPPVDPMVFNPVQWQVMNAADLKTLAAKLDSRSQTLALFSLDAANYKNLSLNLIEIRRYLSQQKAVIAMLKAIIAGRAAATPTGATPSSGDNGALKVVPTASLTASAR